MIPWKLTKRLPSKTQSGLYKQAHTTRTRRKNLKKALKKRTKMSELLKLGRFTHFLETLAASWRTNPDRCQMWPGRPSSSDFLWHLAYLLKNTRKDSPVPQVPLKRTRLRGRGDNRQGWNVIDTQTRLPFLFVNLA